MAPKIFFFFSFFTKTGLNEENIYTTRKRRASKRDKRNFEGGRLSETYVQICRDRIRWRTLFFFCFFLSPPLQVHHRIHIPFSNIYARIYVRTEPLGVFFFFLWWHVFTTISIRRHKRASMKKALSPKKKIG